MVQRQLTVARKAQIMAVSLKRRPLQDGTRKLKKAVVPVKFSSLGTPYVDSSVSAISPQRLEALIQEQIRLRDERKQ